MTSGKSTSMRIIFLAAVAALAGAALLVSAPTMAQDQKPPARCTGRPGCGSPPPGSAGREPGAADPAFVANAQRRAANGKLHGAPRSGGALIPARQHRGSPLARLRQAEVAGRRSCRRGDHDAAVGHGRSGRRGAASACQRAFPGAADADRVRPYVRAFRRALEALRTFGRRRAGTGASAGRSAGRAKSPPAKAPAAKPATPKAPIKK